jgi:hypothetical protein
MPMLKCILVATDFSAAGQRAIGEGGTACKAVGSESIRGLCQARLEPIRALVRMRMY